MKIKIKSNQKQLKIKKKAIGCKFKIIKSISYFSQLSTKAKELFEKIKKEQDDIDPEKFVCVKTHGTIFDFNKFKNSLDMTSDIYRNKSLLKDVENEQLQINKNKKGKNPKKKP